jgi:dipeptidyl-peptidase-4
MRATHRFIALMLMSMPLMGALAVPSSPLTLERLYQLPWLTGTAPEQARWASDSRRLAFLWNDDGGNFRDLWLVTTRDGAVQRVTTLPRLALLPADADEWSRQIRIADVETDPGVTAYCWTADGHWLVFVYRGQLYRVAPGETPTLISNDIQHASSPEAASYGSRVAFIANGALWTVEVGASAPTPHVVHDPKTHDVEVESFYWSGDSKTLAFVETDSRNIHQRALPDYLADETRLTMIRRAFPGEPSEARRVGISEAQGGPVHWLTLGKDPEDQIFAIAWSPDHRHLLIDTSDLYIKDRRLLIVDASSGIARTLVHEHDAGNVTAEWWADWAPDGKSVLFTSDRDRDYHVYRAPLAGDTPVAVTAGDWAVFAAAVSKASGSLFVIGNAERAEDRRLLQVPLSGGTPRLVTPAHGYHEATVSPDGRWIADLHSDDVTPTDLYLGRINQPLRQITHSPVPEFTSHRWAAAHYVSFPNVDDGTLLHARLTLPPDYQPGRRYPVILGSVYSNTVHNRWGGRVYHPTWALDQYLAQQGYVLMNVDISGSSGYGKAFRQRIREDYGGVDVQDLYSGVRYLIDAGIADPRRVGIWGSSYGGLLTTMSLFKKPGVYAAGVAGAPATSLYHAETGEMRTMMAPGDHAAQYAAASPFLYSQGLSDPLMIIHGMRDDTVLFKDTLTLTQRLILEGKDIDLVTLPDAPHGWDTRGLAQTRFAFRKLVDFFRRHLGEGPTP